MRCDLEDRVSQCLTIKREQSALIQTLPECRRSPPNKSTIALDADRIAEETGKQPVLPPARRWSEPDWEQVAPGIECKLLATGVLDKIQAGALRFLDSARLKGLDLVQFWLQEEQRALAEGCNGLRIAGNTSLLTPGHWSTLMTYEQAVTARFKSRRIGIVGHSKDCVEMTTQNRGAITDSSWAQR